MGNNTNQCLPCISSKNAGEDSRQLVLDKKSLKRKERHGKMIVPRLKTDNIVNFQDHSSKPHSCISTPRKYCNQPQADQDHMLTEAGTISANKLDSIKLDSNRR